jgi:hypothetical protein
VLGNADAMMPEDAAEQCKKILGILFGGNIDDDELGFLVTMSTVWTGI